MINQFVVDLAAKLDKTSEEVIIYIETFVLGFGTELQMNKTANFDPFGSFKVEKRIEYVKETEEGVRMLYPPVLAAVFTSSSIQGVIKSSESSEESPIYELFQERHRWDKEKSSLFISQIKSILKSHLLNDYQASIPGFGSFEGELGGDLLFAAAPAFAELINKPFAHFEPVPLNCSAKDIKTEIKGGDEELPEVVDSSSESDETEAPKTSQVEESNQEELSAEDNKEKLDSNEVSAEDTVDINPDDEALEIKEESIVEDDSYEPLGNPEGEKKPVEELTDSIKKTEAVDDTEEEESTLVSSDQNSVQEELTTKEKVTTTPITDLGVNPDTVSQYELEKIGALRAELTVCQERLSNSEEKLAHKDQVIKYFRNLAIILGLFLLVTLFFWYWSSDFKFVHRDNIPVDMQSDSDIDKGPSLLTLDTLEAEERESISLTEDSISKAIAALGADTEEEILPEEPDTIFHTLRSGETLRGLADKYLGSKDKWPEVVQMNKDKIKDPDRVPVGTVIRIIK